MTEAIQVQAQSTAVAPWQGNTAAMLFDPVCYAQVERLATIMAEGRATIPEHLRGNVGDCMAITIQALTWGMSPWPVAQKTHLINGTLGYEAQLVNAVIITMAPTKDRPHYEWFGPWEKIVGKFRWVEGKNGRYQVPDWKTADEEGLGVKVWATIKGEDEPRVLKLLLAQALVRNSTLWACDPKQQLAYLCLKRWSRLHTPDVIMGVYTPDELQEVREINVTDQGSDETVKAETRTAEFMDALKAEAQASKPQEPAKPAEKPEAATKPETAATEPSKTITAGDLGKALDAPPNIVLDFLQTGVAGFDNLKNLALPADKKGLFDVPPVQRQWIVDNADVVKQAMKEWGEAEAAN